MDGLTVFPSHGRCGVFESTLDQVVPIFETVNYEVLTKEDIHTPYNTNWGDKVRTAYRIATVAPGMFWESFQRPVQGLLHSPPFCIDVTVVTGCSCRILYYLWIILVTNTRARMRTEVLVGGTRTFLSERILASPN